MSGGSWGGAAKVYTASREMYEQVTQACPEVFSRMVDAFHMAVAIGIKEGKSKTFKREGPEILNMYSVDPDDVLGPLLCELFPDKSATERYESLLELAEYGIERIHQEILQTATFDPTAYMSYGPSGEGS